MRSLPLNPRIQIDSSPSVPGEDAWLLGVVGDSVRKEVVTCKASVLFFPLRMNPPPNHRMSCIRLYHFLPFIRSSAPSFLAQGKTEQQLRTTPFSSG